MIITNKKKNKTVWAKKIFLTISETLIWSSSTLASSTLLNFNPSIVILIAGSSALITKIAILMTVEKISMTKLQDTTLGDWMNVVSLLYEKTLKQSMIEKKLTKKKPLKSKDLKKLLW